MNQSLWKPMAMSFWICSSEAATQPWAMGVPPQFTAVAPMAGYLAHWRESLDDPDNKIMRPQQVYTGVCLRHYEPMKERTIM
ncbi:unnamed protein product [Brassica rapa subsp. trilocularis]|uniref:(rape) hypothetical protein n=1 Tax=Brassica napus TaxID=3708 RepID=A0A078IEG1_BRANA|nr:unnamed protein product [Brassica napus]CDY49250.1 BnaA09g55290D [Brassica napus]